jgi:hypothetical protein
VRAGEYGALGVSRRACACHAMPMRASLNRGHLIEWAVGIGGQRDERRLRKANKRHWQFM